MTEPVITDAEVEAFGLAVQMTPGGWRGGYKQALAAFLKARVPEPKNLAKAIDFGERDEINGFNICREQVLKGKE